MTVFVLVPLSSLKEMRLNWAGEVAKATPQNGRLNDVVLRPKDLIVHVSPSLQWLLKGSIHFRFPVGTYARTAAGTNA